MATIESSIKLRDGMTPILKNVNKALISVNSAFEKLQKVSGKGVKSALNDLSKAQVSLMGVRNKVNQLNNSFNNSSRVGGNFLNTLKGITSAYMLFQGAKAGIRIADELTMTTARLNLMNDNLQTTSKLSDQIYASAMRSRAGYLETADAVAKLRLRAGQIFTTNDEAIAFSETLNKMFAIAGASQSEMYSATLQLTQALGSGVLRGEEFRAVFEAAPNVMQAVADYMNLPIGKLREIANEGAISADIVKNAMFKASKQVDEQFKTIPKTWGQVWVMFKNHAIKAFEPVLKKISKITNSTRFIKFMDSMGKAVSILAKQIEFLIFLASEFTAVVFDNWYWIAPIIWGVVAAMGAYYLVSFSAWLLDKAKLALTWTLAIAYGLYAAAKWILTSATWAEAKATAVAKAEQWGLNSAMYSCPLLWIIGLVIFFVVAIYLGVTALNHFAGTSISATGVVCATFAYMLANILNVGIYIWNIFASVAEFIANVFTNPVYSIKKLFANLAINILDGCMALTKGYDETATNFYNAMIWAINKVLDGWNWLVDALGSVGEAMGLGKATHFETSSSITSDLSDFKSEIEAMIADKPADYWEAPKHDFIDVGNFTNKAYEWGENLKWEDKISSYFKDGKDKTAGELENIKNLLAGNGGDNSGLSDLGKGLTGGFGDTNDALNRIANNTKSIDSSLSASDEDLSYMRDLAEREAINRYTLTDLKVEQNNNNNFANGVNAQEMLNLLKKILHEGVQSTANGVHF